jgi:hypothetical protein
MIDAARAVKLVRMLSSPNDHEVLAAARLLTKMGIHEVADGVERGSATVPLRGLVDAADAAICKLAAAIAAELKSCQDPWRVAHLERLQVALGGQRNALSGARVQL